VCAVAAALVEMATRFTIAREEYAQSHERMAKIEVRAGELRRRSLELADTELHAFEPVLEALRLPRDDPERTVRVEKARAQASQSPLAIAKVAAELAELAAETVRSGNVNLAGDAITAALIAEAAAQAAARLVIINLTDGPAVAEAVDLARRALAARDQTVTR